MPNATLTLREQRKRRDRLGKIMAALSAIVVVGLFCISYWSVPPVRGNNLCIEGEAPKAYHIVLVDKTDQFGKSVSREIEQTIINKAQAIGMDEMIEVYTIKGAFDKRFSPDISLCNPGRGKEYNKVFHNPAKKDRVYQEKYSQPVAELVKKVTVSQTADQSPILEVLDDITTRQQYKENVPKTVIVISDMAQNTASLSFVQDRRPARISDAGIQGGIQAIAGTEGLKFNGFVFHVYQIEKAYPQEVMDHVKTIWTKIIQDAGGEVAYWGSL